MQLAEGALDTALEAVWRGAQRLSPVKREGPKGGTHVRRDSGVSVMYAEGLNSTTSSVMLQSTDRHGILVRQVALKRK